MAASKTCPHHRREGRLLTLYPPAARPCHRRNVTPKEIVFGSYLRFDGGFPLRIEGLLTALDGLIPILLSPHLCGDTPPLSAARSATKRTWRGAAFLIRASAGAEGYENAIKPRLTHSGSQATSPLSLLHDDVWFARFEKFAKFRTPDARCLCVWQRSLGQSFLTR